MKPRCLDLTHPEDCRCGAGHDFPVALPAPAEHVNCRCELWPTPQRPDWGARLLEAFGDTSPRLLFQPGP